MNAEIISRKPLVGKYIQQEFGDESKRHVYVKFTDKNQKVWVGGFGIDKGNGYRDVLVNFNKAQCLVIANGKGYLIDTNKRSVILELPEDHSIISILKTRNPNYYVAGTENSVFIFNAKGLVKVVKPDFNVEGVYLHKQQENNVRGFFESSINQYDNLIEFKINLSSFRLTIVY